MEQEVVSTHSYIVQSAPNFICLIRVPAWSHHMTFLWSGSVCRWWQHVAVPTCVLPVPQQAHGCEGPSTQVAALICIVYLPYLAYLAFFYFHENVLLYVLNVEDHMSNVCSSCMCVSPEWE